MDFSRKFLLILLAAFGLMLSDAAAQYQYEGNVGGRDFTDSEELEAIRKGEKPDPKKSVPPIASAKPFGVFIMLGQKGLVAISPTAPRSLGFGIENLTSTYQNRYFSETSGSAQGVVPYGGLVLFGWEF